VDGYSGHLVGWNIQSGYFEKSYSICCAPGAVTAIQPNPDKPEGIATKAQRHKEELFIIF
jgi:hypothetical protein